MSLSKPGKDGVTDVARTSSVRKGGDGGRRMSQNERGVGLLIRFGRG